MGFEMARRCEGGWARMGGGGGGGLGARRQREGSAWESRAKREAQFSWTSTSVGLGFAEQEACCLEEASPPFSALVWHHPAQPMHGAHQARGPSTMLVGSGSLPELTGTSPLSAGALASPQNTNDVPPLASVSNVRPSCNLSMPAWRVACPHRSEVRYRSALPVATPCLAPLETASAVPNRAAIKI